MTDVLITGATGTVGSQVAHALLDAGITPRIAVRDPAKAEALVATGATAVRFVWGAPETYAEALAGVRAAFLLVPFVEGFDALVGPALDAAKAAGVQHIVKLSAAGADAGSDFDLARWHGRGDAAVAESGLGWTVLRPTFFQDNLVNYQGASIRATGAFYCASHGGKTAWISARDIGRVAATVLRDPAPHAGRIYDLTGPEALADDEVAALAATARGADVRYVDLEDAQLAASLREGGAPTFFVDAMVGLEGVKAEGWAAPITSDVERVTGQAPERFVEFLARRGDALR
ncbi:MAG: SDR family oxidoreductase [Myxococcota bacterium]